ncbi:hypothetical protein V8C37DRAFT_368474 [Trichoderma ceciliae]
MPVYTATYLTLQVWTHQVWALARTIRDQQLYGGLVVVNKMTMGCGIARTRSRWKMEKPSEPPKPKLWHGCICI